MKFAEQLQPLVEAAGGPTKAAELIGMSRQIITLWLSGDVVPNITTQAGVLFLLGASSDQLPTLKIDLAKESKADPIRLLKQAQRCLAQFLEAQKAHAEK